MCERNDEVAMAYSGGSVSTEVHNNNIHQNIERIFSQVRNQGCNWEIDPSRNFQKHFSC